MKKVALSLAGVLAAVAFAPEASAVPAFARQTGMACTACHAQHFPILNGFGRAFKAGGYTMIGGQEKVEGEHLSIPAVLNASIVMKLRYQKNNGVAAAGAGTTAPQSVASGQLQFFDEFALLMGGRVAENVGFLLEGQMIDPSGPFAAGFKMPFVFDMGAAKLSVIPFETDALGAAFGYELSSGGVLRSNRWSEHRAETSAIQYNAPGATGAATGIAFVAQNDMGFINVTRFATVQGGGSDLKSTYARIAATPTVGDWAIVAGVGNMSGSSYNGAVERGTEQTFLDFQAQGEVAGMETGVYFQYATAPVNLTVGNAYNTAGVTDRKATTIGADFTVIPHALSLGAAYRKAENGGAAATNGDDALTFSAVYDLYQNVALHAVYSNYSGSAYNAPASVTNLLTLMLEAAW
ncbi:MAG: hypothetical protein WC298_08975 [Sideroxydans sp.]|jgi:hypothetical protein